MLLLLFFTNAQIEEAEQVEAAAKKKAKEKQQREAGGLALQEPDGTGVAGSSAGPATLGGYRSTASALHVYRQRQGVALDISGLPGEGVWGRGVGDRRVALGGWGGRGWGEAWPWVCGWWW